MVELGWVKYIPYWHGIVQVNTYLGTGICVQVCDKAAQFWTTACRFYSKYNIIICILYFMVQIILYHINTKVNSKKLQVTRVRESRHWSCLPVAHIPLMSRCKWVWQSNDNHPTRAVLLVRLNRLTYLEGDIICWKALVEC